MLNHLMEAFTFAKLETNMAPKSKLYNLQYKVIKSSKIITIFVCAFVKSGVLTNMVEVEVEIEKNQASKYIVFRF